jgi:hypothetical protein
MEAKLDKHCRRGMPTGGGRVMRAHCADCDRAPASGASARKLKVVPDATRPGMWRVRWPDGRLSDMTNITRGKDAIACFIETEERRQRGAAQPIRRPPVRQNWGDAGSWRNRASKRRTQGRRLRERGSAEAMKPEITLLKKRGPNPVMSKRIFLDAQGKVCSDGSQCLMAQGTATRAAAETAADLASSTSRI